MTRVLVLLVACSSSNTECTSDQVQVTYLGGGTRNNEVDCEPIPASCGATASCSVMACERDMYDLCDSPYLGVGCSDTLPPTIISCNP
jgi:hypothetical protein